MTTIQPGGAPAASGMLQRLQRAVAMAAAGEGAAKPFTMADRGVLPAKPPDGESFPTGLMAEHFGKRAEVARRNLDVLLGSQATRDAEILRTQQLAAAVRARGGSASPLQRDIEYHQKEVEILRPQIEAARKEYEATLEQLRQFSLVSQGAVSVSI